MIRTTIGLVLITDFAIRADRVALPVKLPLLLSIQFIRLTKSRSFSSFSVGQQPKILDFEGYQNGNRRN